MLKVCTPILSGMVVIWHKEEMDVRQRPRNDEDVGER